MWFRLQLPAPSVCMSKLLSRLYLCPCGAHFIRQGPSALAGLTELSQQPSKASEVRVELEITWRSCSNTFPAQGLGTLTVTFQDTDPDVKMLYIGVRKKDYAGVQRMWEGFRISAEKDLCSQPTATNLNGREEICGTCCCDPLLPWLKKLLHFSVLTTLVLQVMNYRSFLQLWHSL